MLPFNDTTMTCFPDPLPEGLSVLQISPSVALHFDRLAYSPREYNALASYVANFQIFGTAYLVGTNVEHLVEGYSPDLFIQEFTSRIRVSQPRSNKVV